MVVGLGEGKVVAGHFERLHGSDEWVGGVAFG